MKPISLNLRYDPVPAIAPPAFGIAIVPGRRRWPAMLMSLAAHAIIIMLVPVLADQVRDYYADDLDWSQFRVEPMRLLVPEPIYYEALPRPGDKRVGKSATVRSSKPADDPAPQVAQHRPAPIPRGIELPEASAPGSGKSTILQPDTRLQEAPAENVPSLAFWARGTRPTPKPRAEVVLPGRAEPPGPPPRLAATPALEIPNMEPNPRDLNIAAQPPIASPSLAVNASSTAPIRDRKSDPASGGFDWQPGQRVNVIAFAESARPREIVTVPRISHAAGPQPDAATSGMSGGPGGGNTVAPGKDSEVTSRMHPRANPVTSRDTPAGAGKDTERRPGTVSTAAAPSGAGLTAVGAEASIRITHPPTGDFDVVVQRSAGRDEAAGTGIGLTGSPVYTVYLSVGDERDWILEFCLPSQQSRNTQYEVFIKDATPLIAPYPLTTVIPKPIVGELRAKTITLHGFLTAGGTFRDIKATKESAIASKVTSLLDEWVFRPARKDREPIEVEILLVVPSVFGRPSELDRSRAGVCCK